jgi:GT2 family glycosyltransferase
METRPAFFSVIIPSRDRPVRLAHCLTAVATLDYPRDRFEVIVVNDGGETPEKVVDVFRERFEVKLITQSHAGPATARNTGAARASGPFLAFTDDDSGPASDWLQALSVRFAQKPDSIIGGRIINGLPQNPYSTASQLLIDYLYAYFHAASSPLSFFTSNNLAVRTEQFRKVGGFDGSFPGAAGEDRELCDRCQHHGIGMIYAPEAIVYHMHELTLRSFWRQHFSYGRGASRFHSIRAARRQLTGVRLEPARFYLNLIRYPVMAAQRRRTLLSLLLVVSQAANAAGFFAEEFSQLKKAVIGRLGFRPRATS